MILVVGAAGEKVRMSKEVGMSLLLHYRRERERVMHVISSFIFYIFFNIFKNINYDNAKRVSNAREQIQVFVIFYFFLIFYKC